MISGPKPPVFPYWLIWEEFSPRSIQWEDLEANLPDYELLFNVAKSGFPDIPAIDEQLLARAAENALHRKPSERLISKLHLLAGWQLTGEAQRQLQTDLNHQRGEMKNLERAADALWEAIGRISPCASILERMRENESGGWLPKGPPMRLSDLGRAARDVSLVAARAYDQSRPKKTGRRPEVRRDTTIRLGAEAIETETGKLITISRGKNARPRPHFTNEPGHLLRDFFKLVEPRTDEALLVQSLVRARGQKKRKVKKTRA